MRLQLGSVLKAVVSQRLVPRADGKGRVAAVEVLKATARVRELIEDKDRTKEIPDAIAQGHQTLRHADLRPVADGLVQQNVITYEEAHRQATNPDDFALRFSGISATSDASWDDFEGSSQDGNSAPGSVAFAQRGAPAAAPAASPGAGAGVPRAATPGPGVPLGKINPTAPRPGAQPAAPKPAAGSNALPSADDDFHIERF